jgi:superfamily II DNA or RNA helicase
LLQEHDWRVRNLIYLDSQYYSRSFMLDALPALYRLIDSPNVLLDGSPVAVRGFDLILAYQRNDRECWLELNHPCAAGAEMYGWSEYFTFLSVSTGEIYIQKLAPHQNELLSAILQTPPIPLALEDEFLKRIEAYRQTLNIVMPTETGGEIVQEPDHPVIVLRVDSAGTLDYGLRLRDGLGILHRPGQGRILRPAERDGRRIQYKRDVEQATQRLRQLVRELGLTTSDQDGSVDDFEKSLDLLGQLQQLESSGVEILWDKQSAKQMRVLGTVSANNVSVGISRKRDWFQLTGSCAVGSDSIELVELLGALEAARSETLVGDYIRIGDRGWTRIESGLRQQLRQLGDSLTQERKNLRFDASSTLALRGFLQGNLDVQIDAVQSWHQCLARLERAENLEPELPANLQAELREYQLDGFRWLRRLSEWGVGGILADDMGLGKTLQTLAVILDRSADGPTLVVAPTSVGFNWVQEAEKFAPDLDVHLYRETDRADFLSKVGPGSLVVCSYGLALRDETQLAAVDWSTLVLDEAQAIKNSRSKTSVAIAKIPARWRVALTGTPVENHLGELWSLFHVVSPGVFGGWDQFRRRFAAPIEKEDCDERKAALRERLKPFVLRRTKGQVLNDLPPRTDMNIYVELSADERAMYDRVRASAIGEIDQIAKLDNVKDQRFRILALLTRLRQMACSPRIVHSQWEHRSSKLIELVNVLHELKEEGHRVLIFSQFVKHLELIREALNAEQISLEYLDGSTPAAQRQKCVDSFQQGTATAFLISLKAGGTGLNLTAADYVIHMDPWWNPAVEDQATDRAHRIGQDKPVMVYRIIARGTIEEEILKLHETKRDLVAGIMDGTHAAAKLSTEDLINLVKGR